MKVRTVKTPKLKPVDLSKAKGHQCPGVKTGRKTTYLAKIAGEFHTGHFGREWYGLNFEAVYDAGLQFDAPGSNSSDWQALWELIP